MSSAETSQHMTVRDLRIGTLLETYKPTQPTYKAVALEVSEALYWKARTCCSQRRVQKPSPRRDASGSPAWLLKKETGFMLSQRLRSEKV